MLDITVRSVQFCEVEFSAYCLAQFEWPSVVQDPSGMRVLVWVWPGAKGLEWSNPSSHKPL